MEFSYPFLHVVRWGLYLSLVLTAFVAVQYASGLGKMLQHPEEHPVQRIRSIGLKLFFTSILIMVGMPVAANVFLVRNAGVEPSFAIFWAVGYGVLLIANLWDLMVIDYLLLIRIKPKSFHLPDTEYYNSLAPHLQAFFKSMILAFFLSIAAAGVALMLVG